MTSALQHFAKPHNPVIIRLDVVGVAELSSNRGDLSVGFIDRRKIIRTGLQSYLVKILIWFRPHDPHPAGLTN